MRALSQNPLLGAPVRGKLSPKKFRPNKILQSWPNSSPSWAALMNLRLDLEKLGCDLSDQSRKMFGLRSCGYEWKEIAACLHMSETAARTAFWREIRRASAGFVQVEGEL